MPKKYIKKPAKSLQERFEQYISMEPNTGCWLWTGASYFGRDGYGTFSVAKNKCRSAHRVSWTIYRGEIPEGMHVLHKCDTPACVNPLHLYLGTMKDNVMDREKRGRHQHKGINGVLNHCAKLTDDAIREIRCHNGSQQEIAKKFGVTQSHISRIKRRDIWKHVT